MKPLTLYATFALFAVGQLSAAKPNIVFLLADDQCTYSVGCYGNKDVKTPHMDRLGADGVIFDNHYVTTSICMASRATVMTGLYEYRHGCNFGTGKLQDADWQRTYPVLLRKAGYLTAFAGKFGIDGVEDPEGSFDVWGGGPGQTHYETAKNKSMAKYAKDWPHSTLSYGAFGQDVIKQATKEKKPFCLSISFKAPHRPTTPDPKFDHVYAGKTFTKPANYGREFSKHFAEQSKKGRQYERFHSWNYSDKYNEVMRIYHQQIYGIDQALGMIRKQLKESGVEDNTVVIYTSDNGFLCGSHGYGSKVLPYEESARVPLMIYDPRHESSGKKLRSNALTGSIDFAPTILELAGVQAPKNLDGQSLLPLLDDITASIREKLLVMNVWGPTQTHFLSVLTQDWKYNYWWYEGQGMEPAEELFHLAKDPLELENLALAKNRRKNLELHQTLYDQAIAHWKQHAPERYQTFGLRFDRNLPSEKKTTQKPRKRK